MPEPLNPQNTIAIVVGVEKYGGGINEISGPAGDAVAFVSYLIAQGVPAENIALHLSPTDANEAACRKALAGLEIHGWKGAAYSDLRTSLMDFPANKAAESLLFFWGGHGVYNPQLRQKLLLCADARKEDVRSLSTDDLLVFLQNKRWPGRNCAWRAAFIDACAEEKLVGAPLPFPDTEAVPGQKIEQIKLAFLESAALGQLARQDNRAGTGERTGIFSNVLLTWLEKNPGLPVDIERLIAEVETEFEKIRAERKIAQRPVFFQYGDWQGRRKNLIDEFHQIDRLQQARRLLDLLNDESIPTRKLAPHYEASLASRRAVAEAGDLESMLANLAESPQRFAIAPETEFAWRVARATGLEVLKEKIRPAKQPLADLEERIDDEQAAAAQEFDFLLIDIPEADPTLDRGEIEIRHWYLSRRNVITGRQMCRDAEEQIREAVLELVYKFENKTSASLFIELYLSDQRLTHKAEQWDYQDMETPLGALHPIVVRWRNRAQCTDDKTRYGVWKATAGRIQAKYEAASPDVCWIEDRRLNLLTRLNRSFEEACVGLLFSPEQQMIRALLRSGAPFAFWRRCECANWQDFKMELDGRTRAGSLREVPRRIRDLREEGQNDAAAPGHDLVILWDDPDRNPLEAQLSNEGL